MSDPRQIIRDRAAARGTSLASLSLLAGRNVAYLQQFVRRGTPCRLPDDVRLHVAMALDLDETTIGARMPWMPAVGSAGHDTATARSGASAARTCSTASTSR